MRKIVMHRTGGPEVLEMAEAPQPQPGPGEVVVQAEAIGVGWPDILIRRGSYKWMPPLPTSPGSDLAGRVVALGTGVDPAMLGRSVLLTARELKVRGGCYAEQVAVPAEALFMLPEGVDLDAAVCLPNYQVAWNLLHVAPRGQAVRSLFINGVAGGVGSALAQLAKAVGITVFGSVSSPEKAAFAKSLGVDHVIDYRREDVPARVLALTAGEGVDLAVDHVGGAGFTQLLGLLGNWGLLVSYNASGGMPPENLLQALRDHGTKCLAIRIFEMHLYDHDREGRRHIMQQVIDALAAGSIAPVVAARLPFAAAAEAHAMVEEGNACGKVLLKPGLDRLWAAA
ncbi:zinc-binding dehydrogenase [Ferrovibrio sp.]|uniref:zinc-binding dehydrogenase n=1 Tax=Ferrovibrio sp. TaxID=1917215 RepID=UPI003D27303B